MVGAFVVFLLLAPLGFTAPGFNLPAVYELVALIFAALTFATVGKEAWVDVPTRRVLVVIGIGAVLISSRVVATGVTYASAPAGIPCLANDLLAQKLECLLQPATNAQPFVRQAFSLIAALATFVATFALGRLRPAVLETLLRCVLAFAILFAAITLGAKATGRTSVLPLWVFYPEDPGRLAFLVQNTSWIWPLAATLFVSSLALRPSRVTFVARVVAGIGLALVSVLCQQRGGLLCVLSVSFALGAVFLLRIARKAPPRLRRALYASTAVVPLGGGAVYAFGYQKIGALLQQAGLGDRFASSSAASNERLLIWKAAWNGIKEAPLWGHGYGRWYDTILPYFEPDAASYRFDTAHNFLVETAYELGLPWALGLLSVFAYLIVCSVRDSSDSQRTFARVLVGLAAFLPIALVQEFNFVRPLFLLYAFTWGAVFTARPKCEHATTAALASNSSGDVARATLRVARSPFVAFVAVALAVLIPLSAFSFAGYQYEASVDSGYAPKVRWYRSEGTFGSASLKARPWRTTQLYAVSNVWSTVAARAEIRSPAGEVMHAFALKQEEGTSISVPAPLHLPLLPAARVKFDTATNDMGRYISTLLEWPAATTSLPLVASRGLHAWEGQVESGKGASRWCTGTCEFDILDCGAGAARVLRLGAFRADVSPDTPLNVKASWRALDASAQPLDAAPRDAGLVFNDKAIQDLPLVTTVSELRDPPGAGVLRVTLQSDRVFGPQPNDARLLGILLVGSECR